MGWFTNFKKNARPIGGFNVDLRKFGGPKPADAGMEPDGRQEEVRSIMEHAKCDPQKDGSWDSFG